jgi:aminoglycoside 6'-N-acetyltransferase
MNITFIPLAESHFPLLFKWIETPHVKQWWVSEIKWTQESIEEKYSSYVKGYKLENGVKRPMHAFVICADGIPIGYIQSYNAYDFPRSKELKELPENLAAIDVYIGEAGYLGKGVGPRAIRQFLDNHIDSSYTHVFVDPDSKNSNGIRAYEKAGFKSLGEQKDVSEVWMLREQANTQLFMQLEMSLLEPKVRSSVSQLNKLIADDFIEFSSSGKVYDKQDLLKFLPTEETRNWAASDFAVKVLSEDVVLVTYKTTKSCSTCLRSSLWKRNVNDWQMLFHQGTKMQMGL